MCALDPAGRRCCRLEATDSCDHLHCQMEGQLVNHAAAMQHGEPIRVITFCHQWPPATALTLDALRRAPRRNSAPGFRTSIRLVDASTARASRSACHKRRLRPAQTIPFCLKMSNVICLKFDTVYFVTVDINIL